MKDYAPHMTTEATDEPGGLIAAAGAIALDIGPAPDHSTLAERLAEALGAEFAGAGPALAGLLAPGGDGPFLLSSGAGGRTARISGAIRAVSGGFGFRGLAIDLTPEADELERMRLKQAELMHRFGNLHAILAGMVAMQARGAATVEEFAADLRRRMSALAHAHRLSLGEEAASASLEALVLAVTEPFGDADGRVAVSGEAALLTAAAHEGLGVALYEWATNAVKHGALSREEGRLEIGWTVEGERFRLIWREIAATERSAPAPETTGAGAGITNRALAGLGAYVTRDWRPEGLTISVEAPAAALLAPTADEAALSRG